MMTSFFAVKNIFFEMNHLPDACFTLEQVKMVCRPVEIKNVCAETSFEIQIRSFSVHYAVKSLDRIFWFINLEIGLFCKSYIFWLYDIQLGYTSLQWRHNGHDGVSFTSLMVVYSTVYYGRRSKKTSKLCVTGLCAGNSPVTCEFQAQMASNMENVSIWWRHHVHFDHVSSVALELHQFGYLAAWKGDDHGYGSHGDRGVYYITLHNCDRNLSVMELQKL